jgi:hypothetical protein
MQKSEFRIQKSEEEDWSSLAAVAMGAAVLNLMASTDWEQNSSWLILQVVGAAAGAGLLFCGIAVGAVRSLRTRLDDRPAPWVLRSMQVGVGIFLLHNLIDFSLFETGPLMLFCFLDRSVLGVRMPSVAGRMKRTGVAVAALECGGDFVAGGGSADVAADVVCGDGGGSRGMKFSGIADEQQPAYLPMLDAAFGSISRGDARAAAQWRLCLEGGQCAALKARRETW